MLIDNKAPDVDIGKHCTIPKNCKYKEYCMKHLPENSIFTISQLGSRAYQLYKEGITRIEDIPVNYPLKPSQKLQVECYKTGLPYIDTDKVKTFLESISF